MAIDRVPLEYPLYGATFGEAVSRFFRKYAVFTGRSSRSEYWWAQLFLALVYGGLSIVLVGVWMVFLVAAILPLAGTEHPSSTVAGPLVGTVVGSFFVLYAALFALQLPLLVPTLASAVRRLHDAGYTGKLALLYLAPGGGYVVLVLCILDSNPSGMRFDPPQPEWGADPVPSSTIRS